MVTKAEIVRVLKGRGILPPHDYIGPGDADILAARIEAEGIELDATDLAELPGIPESTAIYIEAEKSGRTVIVHAVVDADEFHQRYGVGSGSHAPPNPGQLDNILAPVWYGPNGSSMRLVIAKFADE